MRKTIYFIMAVSLFSWNCGKDAASPSYSSPTGQGGSLARFAISGNYMYTIDDRNLNVFDLSDPANPVLKNTIEVGFEIETIYPFRDNLFIGSTSAVHIFSIADPAIPKKAGEAISPQIIRRCDPVVAKDTVAFATLRANGPCGGAQSILAVYDIKNISKPLQRGSYTVAEPYGLGYAGNVLYVCDRSGLLVFDISDPYLPKLLKTITGSAFVDVIPYNGMLVCWVSDGVTVYDIADNRNPVLLAKIN